MKARTEASQTSITQFSVLGGVSCFALVVDIAGAQPQVLVGGVSTATPPLSAKVGNSQLHEFSCVVDAISQVPRVC